MKQLFKVVLILLMSSQVALAAKTRKTVTAKVNGMVCAFCSNSLEKKFNKRKEVESVDVNLDTKLITVVFKENKSFAKKKIKKMIKTSGFSVVSVNMNGLKETNEK